MTDPSPRAGFTVGSLAEVERSLLPLLPPRTPCPDSRGLSHLFSSSTLPHVPSADFLPRRVRSILSLVIYPSSLGVLIPIYRSFCYLSFCVFYNAQGQWPRRGYLREPLRRREQFFALKTTSNSSLCMYFTKCICFMNVYRKSYISFPIIHHYFAYQNCFF